MYSFVLFVVVLCALNVQYVSAQITSTPSTEDQSAVMNIWNYQIERKVKTSVSYKVWDLAVWEEVGPSPNVSSERRYYVTPPVTFIQGSAKCKYVPIMASYYVEYDVQLWERELPSAVVRRLKEMSLDVREDQVHPLPFYQARIIWNNHEQQLQGVQIAAAWINNLQQQSVYTFRMVTNNNATCQLLVDTLATSPHDIFDSLQLQFTVSAAKIDSKQLTISSTHIMSSQLAASLKNLPGADGDTRYLSSNDYNQMLLQISNQVVATEVVSGDYVDADDELSLKDTVNSMIDAQRVDVGSFDERMWNSTFWNPLDARPDQVTKEMNKYFMFNQTDNRWYLTQSSSSSSSSNVNAIIKKILSLGGGGSHSSSSNVTSDQMQHLLEQYDIESDIEGDKFVPKKLDLFRINMNQLTRGDLVADKRVRVRQIEIAGVLQVAVGNYSLGQVEDENRYLRQQIDDMQSRVTQLTSSLEKQTQDFIANWTDRLGNISSNPNAACTSLQTPLSLCDPTPGQAQCPAFGCGGNTDRIRGGVYGIHPQCGAMTCSAVTGQSLACLANHDVRCPDGQVLTRWHLVPQANNFIVEYTCCTLV
jgi:hypothetical protein